MADNFVIEQNDIVDVVIPEPVAVDVVTVLGPQGNTGATGPAGTITIGSVTTGNPGSSATITNTGTASAGVLSITIPRGDTGATGATGAVGATGPAGTTSWDGLVDKPAVIAAGATQADARTAIGAEATGNKGQANGYAALDSNGLVPSTQLPSYVDDVLAYANLAAFPATGEGGKIYVANDTGKIYRWSGSAYIEISGSPGSTDAVPEGATNLYFTAARAQNALTGQLAGKSDIGHGHAQSDITGLVSDLANKANAVHTHAQSDVTGLTDALAGKQPLSSNLTSFASKTAPSGAVVGDTDAQTLSAKTLSNTGFSFATTATTGGTTTLTSSSAHIQQFTGTSSQTVRLPSTGVKAGTQFKFINQASSNIFVQSSNGNAIRTMAVPGASMFTALVDNPTSSAHWQLHLIFHGTQVNNANINYSTFQNPMIAGGLYDTGGNQAVTIGSSTVNVVSPFALKVNNVDVLTTTGNAASAAKLATARTLGPVDLGATGSASFDGTANVVPGVTGSLPQASVTNLTTDLAGKQAVMTTVSVKTSAYSASVNELIPADATSAGFTVTLPAAPANGSRVIVKKIDSSANAVTVACSGSDRFNSASGATTRLLQIQSEAITAQYNSALAVWYVVATDTPLTQLDTRFLATGATAAAATKLATARTLTTSTGNTVSFDGTANISFVDTAPQSITVLASQTANASSNWNAAALQTGISLNMSRASNASQNAYIEWIVTLSAGTWALDLIHVRNSNNGIYTVTLDGSSIGTIDGYAASTSTGFGSITGITVSTSRSYALRFTMSTKNASSTSFLGSISAVSMARTGA